MDAALVTGMFNVGFSIAREPAKDVFTKKDNDFKDVLSKSMESEKKEDVKSTDVDKKETEKIETKDDKDVEKTDVKKKDKKDEKKITDDSDDKTEKINGLIEKRLEDVENIKDLAEITDKLENIELISEDLTKIKDELKNGLVEMIDEVGPQSVETETIKLDKFEKLEEKLDMLAEKLGISSEEKSEKNSEDSSELNQETDSEGETDSAFMSSMNEDVLNNKEVRKSDVKNKDEKFSITDLRKNSTLENNVEQLEMDVQNIDNEIPKFDITNTSNIMMNRAEKLQEQIDVLKQITEKVSVNLLEDKSEMLIKLKPDNLGKVTMQIAVENGNITAKFLAESEKVKEILESSMQELKDHLAKQGMTVQDLSVSVGNENKEREMFNQSNFRPSRRSRNVEKIENISYVLGSEIYEDNDVNLKAFWPDSTVSFSA